MLEGKSVEARRALDASFEVTLHHDQSPGESSTQDSTWATAHGSFQDDFDLKDVTIKQELGQSNLSSEPQDEIVDDSDYEDDSVIKSSEASQDVSESTCQDKAATEHWRNGVMENSDRTTTSEEINSPDLDLLNEICEEATNMTIKEALICSLNPGVRAGLREGRLSMNESEILALEQYCEQFIDNLISQLLAGQWSESMNNAAYRPLDSKAKVAKKLSMLDLETLKSNCDRFVHSIITESLHNFCFGFQIKDTNLPGSDTEFNAKQNALDQKSVQDLLPIFKQSEAIQDYIGFLAADVVKSALANLSTSIATKNGEKNEQMILNNNSTSHDKTSIQGIVCSSKDKQDVQGTNTNNDMRKSYGNFTASGGIENETNRDAVSTGSDDDFELHSLTGALETSLEFDHDVGDWEGGGLLAELHSMNTVTEKKQKIVLRELSFDEHADVAGTELLAPVFLAVAEENDDDDEFQGMRKKAQSIENLCPIIIDEYESPRQRSYSAPKKFRPSPQPVQVDFQPESEDNSENSETELEEGEYEGDEESAIADEDDEDDNERNIEGEEGTDVRLDVNAQGDSFRWHTVSVNGRDKILDLKLLEPYMKVISHGGYFSDTKATIVVIAACYLPGRSVKNYDFLMEQLFFYVISTLELLAIHEEYYLVYLNGGTRQQKHAVCYVDEEILSVY
ncbi:Protein prune 2 [Desmophyllum pertusum]|uniref:Protein prune 2 n=1 Tax=Desmophyllum pertusum TaxID=174260 RepID=A0A9X0A5R9_9CNID|nr:Protein prune 2 [Desmophyllum pertusum]